MAQLLSVEHALKIIKENTDLMIALCKHIRPLVQEGHLHFFVLFAIPSPALSRLQIGFYETQYSVFTAGMAVAIATLSKF